MPKYTSIQFSTDGDFITDYEADTIDEIEQLCADQGSRWIFYPYQFVIRKPRPTQEIMHMRIRSASWPLEHVVNLTVESVKKEIIEHYDGEDF